MAQGSITAQLRYKMDPIKFDVCVTFHCKKNGGAIFVINVLDAQHTEKKEMFWSCLHYPTMLAAESVRNKQTMSRHVKSKAVICAYNMFGLNIDINQITEIVECYCTIEVDDTNLDRFALNPRFSTKVMGYQFIPMCSLNALSMQAGVTVHKFLANMVSYIDPTIPPIVNIAIRNSKPAYIAPQMKKPIYLHRSQMKSYKNEQKTPPPIAVRQVTTNALEQRVRELEAALAKLKSGPTVLPPSLIQPLVPTLTVAIDPKADGK